MCEHELVRLAWQTQKKCHKCGLTEKETILTDKLASAEKALADEKKLNVELRTVVEEMILEAEQNYQVRSQAESQAAAMKAALTEIAHVQPRELTDAVDMREIARDALKEAVK